MDKDYWEAYDDALSEQLYNNISNDSDTELEQTTTQPKGEYTIIERGKPLMDLSGDDNSLDPNFW